MSASDPRFISDAFTVRGLHWALRSLIEERDSEARKVWFRVVLSLVWLPRTDSEGGSATLSRCDTQSALFVDLRETLNWGHSNGQKMYFCRNLFELRRRDMAQTRDTNIKYFYKIEKYIFSPV